MSKKPRFPIPRYPRGWFQVAYADELKPGDVMPIKYFGVELVMFRTEDGHVGLMSMHHRVLLPVFLVHSTLAVGHQSLNRQSLSLNQSVPFQRQCHTTHSINFF